MKKLFLLLFFPVFLFAQENLNPWHKIQIFLGRWQGRETGKAGIGEGEREYTFILQGRYLLSQNISRFKPQKENLKEEVHEDWEIWSYDQFRKTFALRQFNSEGFVNLFYLDTLMSNEKKFVFLTEKSENAPPGLRARLTIEIKNQDEFEEIFEIAFPGKDFTVFLKNYWKRKEQ